MDDKELKESREIYRVMTENYFTRTIDQSIQ